MGIAEEKKVVQRALMWRETEKVMIATPPGPEKEKAKSAHHVAKCSLREAVDFAARGVVEP